MYEHERTEQSLFKQLGIGSAVHLRQVASTNRGNQFVHSRPIPQAINVDRQGCIHIFAPMTKKSERPPEPLEEWIRVAQCDGRRQLHVHGEICL
jgi:hypothetical protein